MIDVIKLSEELIKFDTTTPLDNGITDYLIKILQENNFTCIKKIFSDKNSPDVINLYAELISNGTGTDTSNKSKLAHEDQVPGGQGAQDQNVFNIHEDLSTEPTTQLISGVEFKNLCFAGHVDVVPCGDKYQWKYDPFAAYIENGTLYGRGAVDMKPAIAAFICAAIKFKKNYPHVHSKLSLLITGDEEDLAINGTEKMLKWLHENNYKIDACIIGEPTNTDKIGDTIKIGRRGSVSFKITITGKQGHIAYPQFAHNPLPAMAEIIQLLSDYKFDNGNKNFDPSNLEFTNIETSTNASNVIPESVKANCNIRFNNEHNGEDLIKLIESKVNEICKKHNIKYHIYSRISANSFLSNKINLASNINDAINKVTGIKANLSTSGGTSDARFIKNYCEIAEFGLINKTAHQIDENVQIKDIKDLEEIYYQTIINYYTYSGYSTDN